MSDKELEIINLLTNYNSEEIRNIMIVMTYWEEMINNGIVSLDDINNLSILSIEKQDKIKQFILKKLNDVIEREEYGSKKQQKKELR